MSKSPAPQPGPSTGPVNRHAPTPVERQRAQLDKLLKDPAKPAFIPTAPKDKTIRPPREMMKNVQGSSAGAGSGEFHVYKASRRREYERLKMMDEKNQKVRLLCFHGEPQTHPSYLTHHRKQRLKNSSRESKRGWSRQRRRPRRTELKGRKRRREPRRKMTRAGKKE